MTSLGLARLLCAVAVLILALSSALGPESAAAVANYGVQPDRSRGGDLAGRADVGAAWHTSRRPNALASSSETKVLASARGLRPAVALPQMLASPETQAIESARDGRYAEAITITTQLLDRQPESLPMRLLRAMSYYYAAQPPLALEDLNYVLDRSAGDGTARTLRALSHLELGNYAEAIADAQQALGVRDLPTENLGAAQLVLARVLFARGQHAEATAHFQSVADQPDLANVHVARIALELMAAVPPATNQRLLVRDVEPGVQTLELSRRWIRFQSENGVTAAGAAGVVRLLDAQLAAIGAATGVTYTGPVTLVVYKSEAELERAIGGQYRGPGLSRAMRQGTRTGDAPWQQTLHISITNPSLLFDLTHEAVHLAQAEVGLDEAFGAIPAWLMEGHAEHTAAVILRDPAPHSVRLRLAQRTGGVVAGVRAGRLQELRGLERFGDWGRAQAVSAELTYGQAYYAVGLLHERYGLNAPLRILHAVYSGWPLDLAFQHVTGTTLDVFYAEALDYTRRQVASIE